LPEHVPPALRMLWRDALLLCGGIGAATFVAIASLQEGESIPEFFAHIDVGYSAADFDITIAEEWLHEVLAASTASTVSAVIFDVLDADKDGYVAEAELSQVLHARPEALMHAVHGQEVQEAPPVEEVVAMGVLKQPEAELPPPKPAVASLSTSGMKDSLLPPDVPIYMEWKDVQEYPHAGLILPCFMRNNTDSLRPDLKALSSCAVVGQSSGLVGSRFGALIDKHTHVFRSGVCAPDELMRLKADLGQKTSFCVAFTLGVRLDGKGAKLLMVPKTGWKAIDPGGLRRNWNLCHRQWLVVHPDMVTAIDNLVEDWGVLPPLPERSPLSWRETSTLSNPSCTAWNPYHTGCLGKCAGCEDIIDISAEFYAAMLATTLCQEVVLYGFDLNVSTDAPFSTIHHITRRLPKSKVKDQKPALPLERHLLRIFEKKGFLKIHDTPAPPQSPDKLGEHLKHYIVRHDGYSLLGSGICTGGGRPRRPDQRGPGRTLARSYVKAREGETDAERICNRSMSCTGYQWNPETQSYLLMRDPLDNVAPDDEQDLLCYRKDKTNKAGPPSAEESASAHGGYRNIGPGRCGKRIYESLAAKLSQSGWVTNKDKHAAELVCNQTNACKGYQWRSMDNAYLLLRQKFDKTCCWVNTRPEACYMKVGLTEEVEDDD